MWSRSMPKRARGCGQCVESCPSQIITMVDTKAQVTGETSECLGCESCVIVCAVGGITLRTVLNGQPTLES